MKALMDRAYSFVKWQDGECAERLLEGKQSMLVTTCAGSAENNADLIAKIYEREMDYLGVKNIGIYTAGNCSVPEAMTEVADRLSGEMIDALGSGSL